MKSKNKYKNSKINNPITKLNKYFIHSKKLTFLKLNKS